MQNDLLSIFKAITPDNIKDNPFIEDSMRIFIEVLNENSSISLDIKNMLSENTTESINEELPKIYLYDYYSMIENIKNDKRMVEKFRIWNDILKPQLYNGGMPIIGNKLLINYFTIGEESNGIIGGEDNIEDIFDLNPLSTRLGTLKNNLLQNKSENYYINRVFKQSKGLKKGIRFIYDIINEHLVNQQERKPLQITETGNPFEFEIVGSVDKYIYEKSVAYLSHPLGFIYNYTYLSEILFEDFYGLTKFYNVSVLEVRCLSGNVETYDKQVIDVVEKENYVKIIFSDSYYLLQENDVVNYFDNNDLLVKTYPGNNHCSIFIEYNIEYISVLTDEIQTDIINNQPDENYTITGEIISSIDKMVFSNDFVIGVSIIDNNGALISEDSDNVFIQSAQEEFSIEIY
jgi:hypothetical protein